MWEHLPSHLRTALAVALILVIGVALASFTLSFIALREVAANPITGWGKNAWIFPLCVDAALVASEVAYISVSMVRGINRALPFAMIVLFGAVTVWFNIQRVPATWRMVTAIPPLAGIFMTLLVAFLLKVFARLTGKATIWDAPPPQYGGVVTAQGGPVRGVVYRADGLPVWNGPGPAPPGWWPPGASGQLPAAHHLPENSRNGQPGWAGNGQGDLAGVTKRQR